MINGNLLIVFPFLELQDVSNVIHNKKFAIVELCIEIILLIFFNCFPYDNQNKKYNNICHIL